MVIFEIPTGVVADTSGRRTSFLLSTAVLCFATIGYVGVSLVGGGLFWFCLMSVFLGLGFAFYSGAVEAWLVDALKVTNFQGELDRVFARTGIVTNALMLVGTVGGGLLGNIDLAIPYILRALLLALLCGWAFFYMHDIGYTPRALTASAIPKEMRKVTHESIIYGWQKRPVRLIMIVTFIYGLYSIWGFYASQPYFLDLLGRPDAVWMAGVVSALVSISLMCGNWLVDRLMNWFQFRTSILIAAAGLLSISTIGVGLAGSFWLAVPLFLVGTLAFGILMPVKQGYLNQVIPSAQRATVISFNSMLDSAGGVIGQTGLGYLSRQQGIAAGYVAGGVLTLLAIPFLRILHGQGDPADHIQSYRELPPSAVRTSVAAED